MTYADTYKEKVKEKLEERNVENRSIENLWQSIKTMVVDAAEETLGEEKRGSNLRVV